MSFGNCKIKSVNSMINDQRTEDECKGRNYSGTETLKKQELNEDIGPGMSNSSSHPFMQKVVVKLQELCRAVLVVDTLRVQELNTESEVMMVRGNISVTHKNISDSLYLSETNSVHFKNSEKHAPGEIIINSQVKGSEKSCNSGGNELENSDKCFASLINVNNVEPIFSNENIKDEQKSGNNLVKRKLRCETQIMDSVTSVHRNVDSFVKSTVNNNVTHTIGSSKVIVKEEDVSQSFNEIVHDLSRSHCNCNSEVLNDKKHKNVGDSSNIGDFHGSVLCSTNGISCKMDDDTRSLSTTRCRSRKRKHGSDNFTSLTEDVSNSSVSSGVGEEESVQTFRTVNVGNEIICSTRNCEILVSNTHIMPYQGLSELRSSRNSPYSANYKFSDAETRRYLMPPQPWASGFSSTNRSRIIGNYLEPCMNMVTNTDMPINYSRNKPDVAASVLDYSSAQAIALQNRSSVLALPRSCTDQLHEDIQMQHTSMHIPYPVTSITPPTRISPLAVTSGNETLGSQEEQLLRRIEESLVKTETLKCQEEELLRRLERSLTETESLKSREEELLKKIERSLTKAESLKSREKELLRRIEMSLGHTETVKTQDKELFIKMETSVEDKKYNISDLEENIDDELKTCKLDLDYSLPLKKRKKRLKMMVSDEDKELKIKAKNLPIESFPSFPSRPMISIAELEHSIFPPRPMLNKTEVEENSMLGQLHHHINFPSFPSRPMISIAELQARSMRGKLQNLGPESSSSTVIASRNPHDTLDNICDKILHHKEFLEREYNVLDNSLNDGYGRTFPICKTEETVGNYRCCTSYSCAESKFKIKSCDKSCNELFGTEDPRSSQARHQKFIDKLSNAVETSLVERNDVIDSKDNINLLVKTVQDSVGNKVEGENSECKDRICSRSKETCFVDIDSKSNIKLLENEGSTEILKCNDAKENSVSNNMSSADANMLSNNLDTKECKNCIAHHENGEKMTDTTYIKVERE